MIVQAQIKAKVKAKLLEARNNTTDADQSLDNMVDAILIIVSELLSTAVVTGICPTGGGPLVMGKIT